MRFLYGFILGILAAVIISILYLALGGGDYLLVLSPKYHEMKTSLASLEKAEQQRDQLASKLEGLERRFNELSQRFGEIQGAHRDAPGGSGQRAAPQEATSP